MLVAGCSSTYRAILLLTRRSFRGQVFGIDMVQWALSWS